MSFTPPETLSELLHLLNEIDDELPACSDNAYQMKAYVRPDDLLDPIRQGKLVVLSRGMFRRLRDELSKKIA